MKKNHKKQKDKDPILQRLDAIIRLLIELNMSKEKKEFTEGEAARILNSAGMKPTEIAFILGKKSRTEIAPYLYTKNKR
jgi:hypothetical protein